MKRFFTTLIIVGALLLNSNQMQAQCYSAIELDGVDDYLHTPFSNYNFTNYTIEMWINSANYNPVEMYVNFNINSQVGIGSIQSSTTFFTGGIGLSPNLAYSGIGTTPTPGTWHHIAIVYDGTNQIFYIDGVSASSTPTSGAVTQGNGANYGLAVGARFDGSQQFAKTSFEDVRVWGIARTSAQLNANMSTNLTGFESGLYAYYRFEDGAGSSTVTDLTGNGNTLTMMNMDPGTDWVSGPFSSPVESTDVISNCGPITWVDGNTYSTDNNSAMFTYVGGSAGGCDSIVTLDLTVNTAVDPTVSINFSDITSNDVTAGTQYQWIDCDNNNMPISGETNQTFSAPPSGGNYAVIVSGANSCSDTSDCIFIATNSISETFLADEINLFPNPTKSELNIDSEIKIESIVIVDVMGKTVKTIVAPNNTLDVSDLTKGIYFLQIQTDKGLVSKKFIKE